MGVQAKVIRWSGRRGGRHGAEVAVEDDDRTATAVFSYVYRYEDWRLIRVNIGADDPSAPSLMPSDLRDMPWARWQRAAYAKVREETAQKAPVNEANAALFRLAEVAGAYRMNVARGDRDPVSAIAREYDVKPATARSWVYRARKAGLIDPTLTRKGGRS